MKLHRIWNWEDSHGYHGSRCIGFYLVLGPLYFEHYWRR